MAQTYSNLVKGAEYDQGSTRQAISYYEDFLILFPQSQYLGEVESNLDSMEDLLGQLLADAEHASPALRHLAAGLQGSLAVEPRLICLDTSSEGGATPRAQNLMDA
jgi:hypothetical protein